MKKILIGLLLVFGLNIQAKKYEYQSVEGDLTKTRIYTLDNGLKVYLSVNNEKPRIQTYIAVRTGSKNDPAETTGLAHYLEHLMFKGTTHFGTTNAEAEAPLLKDIKDRYGFNAMEMTSTEIIDRLIAENNEEALDELREIFRTADLVKFAKYSTLINENDANLVAAVEYVNQTKIEVDPNAKPEPEVIKETDQKRLTQVKMMRVAIGVLAVLSVAMLAWIIWRSADLLM